MANAARVSPPVKIGVLGSGKGSNFAAILAGVRSGQVPAQVVLVASDNPRAGILNLAEEAGIETFLIREGKYRTRLSDETETALAAELLGRGAEALVLAGFLRVLKRPLLDAFPGRILNIHPSLLPSFPGLEAWKQALDAGVETTGCTVHLVDAGIDTGEILAQEPVPVLPGDTPESLHARIHEAEHRLYPAALARFCAALRQGEPSEDRA